MYLLRPSVTASRNSFSSQDLDRARVWLSPSSWSWHNGRGQRRSWRSTFNPLSSSTTARRGKSLHLSLPPRLYRSRELLLWHRRRAHSLHACRLRTSIPTPATVRLRISSPSRATLSSNPSSLRRSTALARHPITSSPCVSWSRSSVRSLRSDPCHPIPSCLLT